MTMRLWLPRAYRLLDRLLISRLPTAWQRGIVSSVLRLAKLMFPAHAWPSSHDQILIRRLVQRSPKDRRTLPGWASDDMHDLALHVDPTLHPQGFLALRPDSYDTPIHWVDAGKAYYHICERIQGQAFDTVILVPWLARGGADLGALHHARACYETFRHRTLVISTEPGDSPWATRLPDGVPFLDISNDLTALSNATYEPEIVLARLLIQLSPARIHIINSHLAWRTVARFGQAIRQKTRIYASLYCDERDASGRREGLAQRYLSEASRWLDAVMTDNTASPLEWAETLGVDRGLFHVVHFPCPDIQPASPNRSVSKRLLWASRLHRQKRPDLLAELVAAMPEFHWDIHGTCHGGSSNDAISVLAKLDNATLHGGYDDFLRIAQGDHFAFVYTSSWDGLPNVLLEAASVRLPIVAPDIGGIRDLVPDALLLRHNSGIEDYVRAIRALDDPEVRESHLQMLDERLKTFTWDSFVSSLKVIPGYTRPAVRIV